MIKNHTHVKEAMTAQGLPPIKIEQKVSELIATKEALVKLGAPSQHAEWIDQLLTDIDLGIIEPVPE